MLENNNIRDCAEYYFANENVLLIPDQHDPATWYPVSLITIMDDFFFKYDKGNTRFVEISKALDKQYDPERKVFIRDNLPKAIVSGISPGLIGHPNNLMSFEIECSCDVRYLRYELSELSFIALAYYDKYSEKMTSVARVNINSIEGYAEEFGVLSKIVKRFAHSEINLSWKSVTSMITLIYDPDVYIYTNAIPLQTWIKQTKFESD